MKRLKLHEAHNGRRLVLSDSLDATIFTIKSAKNYTLQLVRYENGQEINGGLYDIGYCYHPSEEQLNHELIQK